ncbi:MAG: ATP-binding protein, partial [Candidatus Saccharimonadales bacterium]
GKPCRCLLHQIMRYQRKLSGPIWDRIDLYSDIHEVEHRKLLTPTNDNKVARQMRTRVINARKLQANRYGSSHKLNASMSNSDIHAFSKLSREAEALLNTAAERLDLSARAYMRSVKVARTIADLADSSEVRAEHLSEALQFRPKTLSFDF